LEIESLEDCLKSGTNYIDKVEKSLTVYFDTLVKLVSSCTSALELAAMTIGIKAGDEVVLPSYTYVGTANAFAKLGANLKFVDVDPITLNMDPNLLSEAVSVRTKAIVAVHYAGHPCNMTAIREIADTFDCFVIEDAAQALGSDYLGRKAGSLGDIGCVSLGRLKNIQSDRGGLFLLNNEKLKERFWNAYHNGTNRHSFENNTAAFYEWKDLGSNFYYSNVQAAYIWPQIERISEITETRMEKWRLYKQLLKSSPLIAHYESGICEGSHNGHIFYVRTHNRADRDRLKVFLDKKKIYAPFHYVPLHRSEFGKSYEYVSEKDFTSLAADTLLRLPIFHSLPDDEIHYISKQIKGYQ